MEKLPLTKTQHETYTYLKTYFEKNGHMPTSAEIAEYFGIPMGGTIFQRRQTLIKKGWLEKTGGQYGFRLK